MHAPGESAAFGERAHPLSQRPLVSGYAHAASARQRPAAPSRLQSWSRSHWYDPMDGQPVRPTRQRMTDARRRVLELAEDGFVWTRSGLAHAAGVSLSVVDGLSAAGTFQAEWIPPRPIVAEPDLDYGKPELTERD